MIITALSIKEANMITDWLKSTGYEYKASYFWSQEWEKDGHVIYLHKGFRKNGDTECDWQKYTA